MSRQPVKKIMDRVIWDTLENQMHRGPLTKGEARSWIRMAVRVFGQEMAVKKMFEIRRIVP